MSDDGFDFSDLIAEEVGETEEGTDSGRSQIQVLADRIGRAENAFDILGVTAEADGDTCRSAYMELAGLLHPDRYADAEPGEQEMATDLFDKAREAWDQLDSDEKRQKYIDHVILGKPTEEDEAMEQVRVYLNAESDFKKGLAAFNAGRISAAHKLFEAAGTNAPEELEFQVYLSYTTFSLNRKTDPEKASDALTTLKDVLDLNQQQERRLDGGWVLLGRAYRELGDVDAAKRCLIQALRFNPANPDAPRELRRLEGGQPGGDFRKSKKLGFFGKLFKKKKKK